MGIEDEIIKLPDDICEKAFNENWFSLIGKPLIPRKQNLRAMMQARGGGEAMKFLEELWVIRKCSAILISIGGVNAICIEKIGHWAFNDWMCVIQKWILLVTYEDLKKILFWVQIREIPIQFLTRRMITHIGLKMEHLLEIDFDGESVARVRLNWAIDVHLRFQRIFRFGEEALVLKFRYEKLRNFCKICGLLTHEASECPTNNPQPEEPADNDNDDDDDHQPGFPHLPTREKEVPEGNHESDVDKNKTEHKQTVQKKRKTKTSTTGDLVPVATIPLIIRESRETFMAEDLQKTLCKRQRTHADVLQFRN